MANNVSAKYVISKPLYISGAGYKGRQSPTMTMISGKQIPGCDYYIELGWIYDIPSLNPRA